MRGEKSFHTTPASAPWKSMAGISCGKNGLAGTRPGSAASSWRSQRKPRLIVRRFRVKVSCSVERVGVEVRLGVLVAPDVGRVRHAVGEARIDEAAAMVDARRVRRAPAVAELERVVAARRRRQEVGADHVEAVGRTQERRRLERAAPRAGGRLEARLHVAQLVFVEVEHEVVAEVRPHHVDQQAVADARADRRPSRTAPGRSASRTCRIRSTRPSGGRWSRSGAGRWRRARCGPSPPRCSGS